MFQSTSTAVRQEDLPHGPGSGTHGTHAQRRSVCNRPVPQYGRSVASSVETAKRAIACPVAYLEAEVVAFQTEVAICVAGHERGALVCGGRGGHNGGGEREDDGEGLHVAPISGDIPSASEGSK